MKDQTNLVKFLRKVIEKSGHKLAEKLFIEDEEKLILKHLKKSIKKKMLM